MITFNFQLLSHGAAESHSIHRVAKNKALKILALNLKHFI